MKHRNNNRCPIGAILAAAAFLGALMCVSFFSLKVLLITVAVLLIIIGIFLLKV